MWQWDDIPCGRSGIFGDSGKTHPYMCEYSKLFRALINYTPCGSGMIFHVADLVSLVTAAKQSLYV